FCVSLDDGVDSRARVRLPADALGAVCRGAIGSWLALAPPPPSRPHTPAHLPRTAAAEVPFLINAYSLDRVPLPVWRRGGAIRKVVLSSAPDSRATTCVVAAVADRARRMVAVCRPTQAPRSAWTYVTAAFDVEDIAFHEGELYMLDATDQLHRVAMREPGAALRVEHYPVKPAYTFKIRDEESYLVELDGALVMAQIYVHYRSAHIIRSTASLFTLRHDERGGGACRRWSPGVRLDGRFLVFGNSCCGAFRAAGAGGNNETVVGERELCFVDVANGMAVDLPIKIAYQLQGRRCMAAGELGDGTGH
ncbi:hypothetical protein E2562_037627, partial [Oryza meyeriana var. granulata]